MHSNSLLLLRILLHISFGYENIQVLVLCWLNSYSSAHRSKLKLQQHSWQENAQIIDISQTKLRFFEQMHCYQFMSQRYSSHLKHRIIGIYSIVWSNIWVSLLLFIQWRWKINIKTKRFWKARQFLEYHTGEKKKLQSFCWSLTVMLSTHFSRNFCG